MDQPSPAEKTSRLKQVQERFEYWRRTRAKRRAIPDQLWEAAIALFPNYSLYRISTVLRLNYSDLKRRVETQRSYFEPVTSSDSTFIELGLSDPIRPAECMVEMADEKGASLRMYFKGQAGLDLLELGKAFWSKRS